MWYVRSLWPASAENVADMDADTGLDRSCMLLHVHDSRRRRWQASRNAQVPGRVPSGFEGQFHGLASGADPQLPLRADTASDCESHDSIQLDSELTATQPFVSTIGIAWTAYLSMANSVSEELIVPSNENSP